MCLLINLLPMIQNKAFHSRQALPRWRPFKETLCMSPCLAYNVKTMLVMSGRISQWVILFRFSSIQQLRAPVRNVLLIWGDLYVGVFKEIACIITNRVLPNVAEVYFKKKTKKQFQKTRKALMVSMWRESGPHLPLTVNFSTSSLTERKSRTHLWLGEQRVLLASAVTHHEHPTFQGYVKCVLTNIIVFLQ